MLDFLAVDAVCLHIARAPPMTHIGVQSIVVIVYHISGLLGFGPCMFPVVKELSSYFLLM